MIDLHTHSHYSDGQDSYEDLFTLAMQSGVSYFSITDHNYLYPGASSILSTPNMKFVQGVEVSSIDRPSGMSLHVLGYSFKFDIPRLNRSLESVVHGYNARAAAIISMLNTKFGTRLDFEHIKATTPAVFVSRNLIARHFREQTHEQMDMSDAVKEAFIQDEDSSWMPDAVQAIDMIRVCGGTAVLAHPGNLLGKTDLAGLVERLAGAGLRGIEVQYPRHDQQTVATLIAIANRCRLAVTAGSDWHGIDFSRHPIGMEAAMPSDLLN
jgi:predicted metal-dependent phosphoesterase TrpH